MSAAGRVRRPPSREILLVRHAIAFDRDSTRWPDDETRPLTDRGRRRFETAARGLVSVCDRPTKVFSSGFTRADETAAILHDEAEWPAAVRATQLRPDADPAATLAWLRTLGSVRRIALVGHEPHLHALASLLLAGAEGGLRMAFKKGSVACLTISRNGERDKIELTWFATPRLLRSAAKGA